MTLTFKDNGEIYNDQLSCTKKEYEILREKIKSGWTITRPFSTFEENVKEMESIIDGSPYTLHPPLHEKAKILHNGKVITPKEQENNSIFSKVINFILG